MSISQRAPREAISVGRVSRSQFLAHGIGATGFADTAPSGTLRSAIPKRDFGRGSRSERYPAIVAAIALHIALIVALLQYEPARRAIESVAPIMVSLVAPALEAPQPPPEQPKTVVEPPRPQPVHKPVEPPPIIARPPEPEPAPVPPPPEPLPAPALEAAKPEPPALQPVAKAEPAAPVHSAPAAVAAAPVEAIVKPAPPQPAPPVIPPDFNADYLHNPAPAYPQLARRMGEQGKVLVRVLVSAEGRVERIELKSSSGSRRLDQAALDAVKQWKFVPARQGDQQVPAWVVVPIVFTLQG